MPNKPVEQVYYEYAKASLGLRKRFAQVRTGGRIFVLSPAFNGSIQYSAIPKELDN